MKEYNPLKDILTQYQRRGFYLFPVSKRTHRPVFKDNLEKATNDLDQMFSWWDSTYVGTNVGLSCAKSGLVAVDIDVKHGGLEFWESLVAEHGEPSTLTARTPSGGLHYIFKANPKNSYVGKICDGIDIKHNGYVLLCPSISAKNGDMYRWARMLPISEPPLWLANMIEKKIGSKRTTTFTPSLSTNHLTKLALTLKEYELTYDEWFKAGMAINSALPSEEGLALWIEMSKGPSYKDGDEEQCRIKWESFDPEDNAGITVSTLSWLIRKKGGVVPNPHLEEDKEFFKANFDLQLSKIKEHYEQSDEDFTVEDEGNRRVSWNESRCVEGINRLNYVYMLDNKNCIGKYKIDPDGTRAISLYDSSTFLSTMAPFVYRFIKHTATGSKIEEENAGRVWMRSLKRKECKGVVFEEHDREGFFNLYTPLSIPRKEGNPDYILDLLYNSLCEKNDAKFNWLLDWSAHIFQKPFEKGSTVPVHITEQGRGKGLYYDYVLGRLLGRYKLTVTSAAEITAQFNTHLANRFLTFLDESSWRGNRTEDGILKRLIASPTISVEEKFGARYEVNNFSRYAFGSNNEEAVAMEIGNRRYVILEATERGKGNDLPYFQPISDAIKGPDEVYKFYNLLMSRDISHFNPFRILPNNTGGRRAKISTMGSVAMFWEDLIFEAPERLWNARGLDCEKAFDAFYAWTQRVKPYDKGVSRHHFWFLTKKFVAALPDSVRVRDGIDRTYTKKIDPRSFAEGFCKTIGIGAPENFDHSLFYSGEEFDAVKSSEEYEIDW